MTVDTGSSSPTLLQNELTMQVSQALKTLADEGLTPTGVAEYLMRLGVEGERLNGGNDPIAYYLMRTVRDISVYVSPVLVTVRRSFQRAVEVALPPVVAEFLAEFDSGAHSCVAVSGV